jgi:KUP system potassium uptake protein
LEDLSATGEISTGSKYESMNKYGLPGDFRFILIDRVMPKDNPLPAIDNFTLMVHNLTRGIGIPDVSALHLDSTNTIEEAVPITVDNPVESRIVRVT